MRILFLYCVAAIWGRLFHGCQSPPPDKPGWPAITNETKPWTRWWWHGNALTKEGITSEMEKYQKAGLGGLEITPIYGVQGYEDKFVDYLSPGWMELLLHTLKEAERLGLGIDMATGTGWPFGGPWVSETDACKNFYYKVYELNGGSKLSEKVHFTQEPYVRAVGNNVYELGQRKGDGLRLDPRTIDIRELKQPIADNKNLQRLALDQVQFERPLRLITLMAYGESKEIIDLTSRVDPGGSLDWEAPAGKWNLYALFEGWHGKMVERAGPGGEGNVIDHFSAPAPKHYLNRFDSAFRGRDIQSLRAFFNDSYEVDDARGAADWTPTLFEEFKKLNGYDLREFLPALLGRSTEELNRRILCDYRQTVSELLLKNFTQQWSAWAHDKSALVRNQAHGSPANILDLYATVDIPEIEGVEPLRIRMASSAGNVTGKKLISSESATWLNEHFQSSLSDIKIALDRFMLNGVNHIFYHGTSYSPPGEPWPGWLFYAAVHLNPQNPQWSDFGQLNTYVARCQSFLQNSEPDNDVLLYYPIHDRFSTPGPEMVEHFDGIERQFANTAFERAAQTMLYAGYSFDYISDKQIDKLKMTGGAIQTEGSSTYKAIVIPHSQFIPLETFQKIVSLAGEGATIVALEGLPSSVSGYRRFAENSKSFDELVKQLSENTKAVDNVIEMKIGDGRVLQGDSLRTLLSMTPVKNENLVSNGFQFVRKKKGNRTIYFIANKQVGAFSGWLPLNAGAESAVLYDPMTGGSGTAKLRKGKGGIEIFLQMNAEQSMIVETYENKIAGSGFPYHSSSGDSIELSGTWKITFLSGGPELPDPTETDNLYSWTLLVEKGATFSGTAAYSMSFARPAGTSAGWLLDLGSVKESADVYLNGNQVGVLIGPDYQLYLDSALLKEVNQLEIRVSNLMANRIAYMDKKKILWKKFYNVNFPARLAENRKNGLFDASDWVPRESGLLGPVKLIPVDD